MADGGPGHRGAAKDDLSVGGPSDSGTGAEETVRGDHTCELDGLAGVAGFIRVDHSYYSSW
eukprot:CAMPEP_0170077836 /NCGR_PEP_ID=MMETSP0019_2-20121128/14562_1 /TAXON_ID=98059 /ORGANISM="Dinobryon sp., Strain UTEXLB2267" /LENGTH=60 /DNA_ID=CAMNT_0010290381 /DNA_START=359 /DNA_END=538 /DNA_ORIENTATION=-